MGLFNFVKNAGKKLLGMDDEKEIQRQAQVESMAAEQRETLRRRKVEARLKQHLGELGLEIENPTIRYDGEKLTLGGKVKTQEIREKVILAAGNHEGISEVEDDIEVVEVKPEAVFYTVVKGDTLSKIAKQHYGNANKYPVIFEANRPMLSDPDKIYPGQVLRIPPLEG